MQAAETKPYHYLPIYNHKKKKKTSTKEGTGFMRTLEMVPLRHCQPGFFHRKLERVFGLHPLIYVHHEINQT